MKQILGILATALCIGHLAVPSNADEDASSNWSTSCLTIGVCEMHRELFAGNTVAARVSILNYRGRYLLQYTIPLGIDIRQGVYLRVDDGIAIPTVIDSCSGRGCSGTITLTTPVIQSMKQGGKLNINFFNAISKDSFAISFSLQEFTSTFSKIAIE